MTLSQQDVCTYVENTLRAERVRLAQLTDRVEALRDLRAVCFEFTQRHGRALLTMGELWESPADETERARLTALVERALPIKEN